MRMALTIQEVLTLKIDRHEIKSYAGAGLEGLLYLGDFRVALTKMRQNGSVGSSLQTIASFASLDATRQLLPNMLGDIQATEWQRHHVPTDHWSNHSCVKSNTFKGTTCCQCAVKDRALAVGP